MKSPKHWFRCSRLLLVLLFFWVGQTQAQVGMALPASEESGVPTVLESPEAVREMVSRLSDGEVRSLLLEYLDGLTQQRQTGGAEALGVLDAAGYVWNALAVGVQEAVVRVPNLLAGQTLALTNFGRDRGVGGVFQFIGFLLLAIALGYAAERLVDRGASRWRERIRASGAPDTLRESIRILGLRLLLDVIGLVVFLVVTQFAIRVLFAAADFAFARELFVYLVVYPRIMAAVARFLLAPHRPELRLVHTDDAAARYIYRNFILLTVLMGFSTAVVSFNQLAGVPMGELRLGFWLNGAVHVLIAVTSWRAREGLVSMLMGDGDVTPMEAKIARLFPYYCIAVSLFTWVFVEVLVFQQQFALLKSGLHFITMIILILAPCLDTLIRGLVKHLVPPMQGAGRVAEAAYESTKRSYLRMGRVVGFGLVIFVIAGLWNIDFANVASAGVGVQAAARIIEVLMIFAIGYLIWEGTTLWFNRKLAAEQTAAGIDLNDEEPGGGEGGGAGASRLSTVLPLFRLVVQTVVIVMTVLIGLGNIGIDVTPLLAGAGIVGLAIGFGAQKLVADVVSGIFFLVDDAFRAGEYIDVEGTVGTVERISLRALQLRHHRGHVHTIPYGEIPKITNYSRDWVIMKLRFTVPFETDLNKVKKIFKTIGAEMMQVPEFAEDFLQPFKSQGVLEVDDVGIVVRGKFMAKPGKQFVLRKEIYQRVQRAFEANGLQFARKEVRVKLDGPGNQDLTGEEREAVAAAASDAAEKPAPEPASKADPN